MVNLTLIDKKSGQIFRRLRDDEVELLLPDNRCSLSAQALLHDVSENGLHLECHCTTPPALMFTRKYMQANNHIGLVCHPIKGGHDDSCPLFRVISGDIVRDPKSFERILEQQALNFDSVSLLNEFTSISAEPDKKPSLGNDVKVSGSVFKPAPKLTKLISYLIETAGFNRVDPSKFYNLSKRSALEKLIHASSGIGFGCIDSDCLLSDWSFYGDVGHKWACSKLYNVERSGNWKKGGRPHALVFQVVDSLEINDEEGGSKYLVLDGGKPVYIQKVISNVVKKEVHDEELKCDGPYLVVYTIARPREGRAFQGHTAYITPIISEGWLMPINSNNERNFAKRAIYHLLKSNNSISFERSMIGVEFDVPRLASIFMLSVGDDKHVIEVKDCRRAYSDEQADLATPMMKHVLPDYVYYELDPNVNNGDEGGGVNHYINNVLVGMV
ncbi:hypothetical protein AB6E94_18925 [Vibrio lentus]|uniref:hypothetical protein n=1 Tax=Vibrio splendidus TaxID=29497 RepID=UPI000C81D6D1|nr:hypothetical protein [Vibrio splendidus]PMG17956.1 hypothetical protein BCU98_01060 [Vibrio splendidus]